MSAARVKRPAIVPEPLWLTDGGETVAVALSSERHAQFVADVERLELELRAWKSEIALRDGTQIEHEDVVAASERFVGEG